MSDPTESQQKQNNDVIYCKHHPEEQVTRVCNNPECNKDGFICSKCVHEGAHEGHPSFGYAKLKAALIKFVNSSRTQQDLTKEGQLSYARMQNYLEETSQSIYKQAQKLNKLSQFMENLNETLLSLQEIGEEVDIAYTILYNMDKKESGVDVSTLNDYLNQFRLLMDINLDSQNHEVSIKPSSISQLRIKNILDKKADFTSLLRKTVEEHEQHFQKFLKEMGDLLKENKQFLVPKANETEENRNAEFGKRALYNSYYKQDTEKTEKSKKKVKGQVKGKVKHEDDEEMSMGREYQIGAVEKCGIPKLDQGQPPQGIKKQMFKLCNYLIFYNTLMCDSILPEPILRGVPLKKMQQGELKFPIRCAFCRLLKIRSFVQFYFRFDLVSRFGKLCLFKDKEGREICSHEMCLLWSNRVQVDYNTMLVDIATLIQAVQFAQAQMCRYCGSIGASLKCNKAECHVHYHFNCLKQVRLMGLQLDHEQKFRFFCEDHVRHNYQGQSDWFITRIRMKHIIQQGGQPAFTKKNPQIDWSTRDSGLNNDSDMEEQQFNKKHRY
ncbi:unnamed protein product [Paramecium primaurelia]|uniref:PHD-type domain-containing protein n=2 Tax=Paramecium TaxID=5884 RepID=A0A8S1SH08_9CILI|nr:unnamed protein product [Paramecium primaurelia]CAD8138092.1 unnamed protein product [Paramecium pentaurelia]